jgi:hypothetical protein
MYLYHTAKKGTYMRQTARAGNTTLRVFLHPAELRKLFRKLFGINGDRGRDVSLPSFCYLKKCTYFQWVKPLNGPAWHILIISNDSYTLFWRLSCRLDGKDERGEGWQMVVYKCDLCGRVKECLQKQIDHREYDICRECWSELEVKLKGKGRGKGSREIIFLPPAQEPDKPEEKPTPGEPPIIQGKSERPN